MTWPTQNLDFNSHYDLHRFADLTPFRDPPTSRPTDDMHYAVYGLRRAWDHLPASYIVEVLKKTHATRFSRNEPPRMDWLVVGLAAHPSMWFPPLTVEELVSEVSITVDGTEEFRHDLLLWATSQPAPTLLFGHQ